MRERPKADLVQQPNGADAPIASRCDSSPRRAAHLQRWADGIWEGMSAMSVCFISHATADRHFVENELIGFLKAIGIEPGTRWKM